jgi:hypothetical protein
LSEVIPQDKKETDPLLLLAAYYYNKNSDLQQVKTDMSDYIGFLNNNRMPLIKVDLISKEPPNPWNDYLHFTQIIHGHQGEDAAKQKTAYRPSDIDFQNEQPIEITPDGKIKVYAAKNTQQCIILGKGQSFCISQPGNRMWQSYRDTQTSTFYFVYDDTRDDRLSIVVVDVQQHGIELTDKVNRTGTTLDPYTNKLTTNSSSYIKYLKEKGIDVSKFVNSPKTDEEIAEDKKLGNPNQSLDWFISLSPEEKSKYIGRGHNLTDEQFDFLWDNKFNSLLTQYVKTGLLLDDYQFDKIISKRDLKDNYLHNRIIANQHTNNLTKKEFSLLKDADKHKIIYSNAINAEKFGLNFQNLVDVKDFLEKCESLSKDDILILMLRSQSDETRKLIIQYKKEDINKLKNDDVKYLLEKSTAQLVQFDAGNLSRIVLAPTKEHVNEMAELLGEENINKLTSKDVSNLLSSATDKDNMAKILGENIQKLETYDVRYLLSNATDPNEMAKLIIQYKTKLSIRNVENLLSIPTKKDEIAKLIIQNKTELTSDDVDLLLFFSRNEYEIAKLIGEENIKDLKGYQVYMLLYKSPNKNEMAKILRKENISNLSFGDINGLLITKPPSRTADLHKHVCHEIAEIINQYHTNKTPEIEALIQPYL